MVRRRLADSRAQAVRLIESGSVLVGGAPADKPARMVDPGEAVTLAGPPPRYVGRGGEKLEAALDRFAISVTGRHALDAGSSTGGFTDCLLQAGAERVVAVDVGRAQLHERLRRDPRVEVRERTDIRDFAAGRPERFGLVVADLSFISVRRVAASLVALCEPAADLVVLVKPQFEAGRAEASRGRGVIRDPQVWARVVTDAIDAFHAVGAANIEVMVSPLRGADGNVEFLAHFRPGALPSDLPADSTSSPVRLAAAAVAVAVEAAVAVTDPSGRAGD